MKNIHHIHEVLQLLFQAEIEFTVEDLYTKLRNEYGEDVHFCTCSENIFPVREVVPFLLSKHKIRISENTIIPLTPACSH